MSQDDWDLEYAKWKHDWDLESYKRDTELYKLVSEHYRQDLREFWSRSGMYILSQAFLFAAFATLAAQSRAVDKQLAPIHLHDVWFEGILGFVGMVLALIGFGVARASAKWIHSWREEMKKRDSDGIDRFHSFSSVEKAGVERAGTGLRGYLHPRCLDDPVWLTQLVSLLFFLGWLSMTAIAILARVYPLYWDYPH
jgi:hypothetical protein